MQKADFPAVTVVVPCFNGGQFIGKLVDHLRKQTFQNFEIIVVDDGSTDAVTRQTLAALGPDITVLRQENGGPAAARNTGIRHARAPFIQVIDCDDTLDPTHLAKVFALLRDSGPECGFVFTDMRVVGLKEGIEVRHFNFFDQLFINRVPSCLLFRKEAWEKVGGYDESMRFGYEDWEFTIALGRAGYVGAVIHEPLFHYRVSSDGLMMSQSSPRHAEIWRYIRNKHWPLYTPTALLRLYFATRTPGAELSLRRAASLLGMAKLLPDRFVSRSIHRYRLRKLLNMPTGAELHGNPPQRKVA